jgi:uncharacterized LabA/DUF88 family protein
MSLGFNLDYNKLFRWLNNKFRDSSIVIRRFYTGVPEELSDGQREFHEIIENIGYTLVTRELKEFKDSTTGVKTHKGDMDARMGFDMAQLKTAYDVLVYVGGDGDFSDVFKSLVEEGKQILILSTRGFVASELLQLTQTDQTNVEFVDIKDVRREIGREKARRYA